MSEFPLHFWSLEVLKVICDKHGSFVAVEDGRKEKMDHHMV